MTATTVSGTVYMDDDFSAAQNGSEKSVQGIPVTLLDAGGNKVASATTNAKGRYTFEKQTPGEYSLRMTAKEGYAFTRQGDGNVMLNLNYGEGYTENFPVDLGVAVDGMNAGMIRPAKVEGTVFADRNDNGLMDEGEGGLEGALVCLMTDAGEEAFRQTIGEDGVFLFDAVMPGAYLLRYELPENGIFARVRENGNRMEGEGNIGETAVFELKIAEERTAALCGALTLGTLEGAAWQDHNGNGAWESGEEALAEVRITLTPVREDVEAVTAVSDAEGHWMLDALRPGEYTLEVAMPEDFVTSRMPGNAMPIASGYHAQSVPMTIAMGQTEENQVLGGARPATLSGRVWLDENNDGKMDGEEARPAGLTVTVLDDADGSVFATLRTDENGAFMAEGMIPGSFTVIYELKENETGAAAGDSTFTRGGSRLEMAGLTLAEGESRTDLTMGFIRYTAMGGEVWMDLGGTVEALSGAEITLEDWDGIILERTETLEDGVYRFSGLLPGLYRVGVTLPEGALALEPGDERLSNGLISAIMEADGRHGYTPLIDLRMGEDQLELNLGSVLPGTIGDRCWLDLNGNGYQDGDEPGLPGVTIELTRNGVTMAQTVSEKDGFYWFREVYPAVYTLKVTAPAEVKPTQKRTDIYLIVSSLLESEEAVAVSDPIQVQSDVTNYNMDLGFVLRQAGVYPAGLGEGRKMDWSIQYAPADSK